MRTLNGADDGGTPVEQLARVRRAREEAARAEAVAVRRARRAGMSWAGIGTVLGVSKQAMHKKYGKRS
ncbi:MAG: RNA polymerase subunit sigma-70 [Marmoricola sp.]